MTTVKSTCAAQRDLVSACVALPLPCYMVQWCLQPFRCSSGGAVCLAVWATASSARVLWGRRLARELAASGQTGLLVSFGCSAGVRATLGGWFRIWSVQRLTSGPVSLECSDACSAVLVRRLSWAAGTVNKRACRTEIEIVHICVAFSMHTLPAVRVFTLTSGAVLSVASLLY